MRARSPARCVQASRLVDELSAGGGEADEARSFVAAVFDALDRYGLLEPFESLVTPPLVMISDALSAVGESVPAEPAHRSAANTSNSPPVSP